MEKRGRNDPCPCGSGKKFKKCCESKMIRGKFMATKMDTPTSKLGGLFQARVTQNIRPPDLPVKPIAPSTPSAPESNEKQ